MYLAKCILGRLLSLLTSLSGQRSEDEIPKAPLITREEQGWLILPGQRWREASFRDSFAKDLRGPPKNEPRWVTGWTRW